jgi:hypothetical protein
MPGPHAGAEVLKTTAVTPQNAMTSRAVHSTTLSGHSSRLSAAPLPGAASLWISADLLEQDFTAQTATTRPSSQAHYPFRAYLACPRTSTRIRQKIARDRRSRSARLERSQLKGCHNTEQADLARCVVTLRS